MVFTCLSTFVNTKADNCRTLAKLPNRKKAASRTGYPSNSFEAPMPRCERSPSRNPARKPPPPPPAEEVLQWIGSRRLSGQVQPWLGRTDGSEGSTLAFEGRIEGLLWLHEAHEASKTKHEELPRCAILGHVDARTHVSCSSSSSELGGRCAEGCQEALCGREDCPQGLQVGGGGVCGVQRDVQSKKTFFQSKKNF